MLITPIGGYRFCDVHSVFTSFQTSANLPVQSLSYYVIRTYVCGEMNYHVTLHLPTPVCNDITCVSLQAPDGGHQAEMFAR